MSKNIMDVSHHQGSIDWEKVKKSDWWTELSSELVSGVTESTRMTGNFYGM